ncbi:hypothetical protein KDW37_28895 [Burkholderia cenocepacia]|uniref:hypothetical protein n=1 Tax=Burkholderia cenocepacia TaxID=95486 RepID=UPI001BA22984|nr:hypothetical protein [Burkholderia cenocepacia]MBR8434786.1 hypothetical protein [Burkholderia cenocepacia]
MSDQQYNRAAVRVCAISDVECSRDCGTGFCKREREARYPVEQHEAAPAIDGDGDLVLVERGLLGAACRAIDKKRDAPKVLEKLRAITSAPKQPEPTAADERAAFEGIVCNPDERVSMTMAQYAELQCASAMLDWLEHQIRKRGMQGISFDWIPSVEGETSGFRYMRRHLIAEPKRSLREAIDAAQRSEK